MAIQPYSTGQRDCSITRVQRACTIRTLHAVSMQQNECNYMRVISLIELEIACKITRSPPTGMYDMRVNENKILKVRVMKTIHLPCNIYHTGLHCDTVLSLVFFLLSNCV